MEIISDSIVVFSVISVFEFPSDIVSFGLETAQIITITARNNPKQMDVNSRRCSGFFFKKYHLRILQIAYPRKIAV